MKTLQVSKFKAHCLRLLKEIRDTGEPLVLTLRGETLAVVQPPNVIASQIHESIADTLKRLKPLLLIEDEELETPSRGTPRPSARNPFPEKIA